LFTEAPEAGLERFKLVPEVHLILVEGGRVLLPRRCNTGYEDGAYGLVAGHVDGGESFRSAMAREAAEEVGIRIPLGALALVQTMHRRAETERLSLFFTASEWAGELANREPHKCDELRWVAPGDWPANTIPYVRFALDRYFAGEGPYFEFGWD
jgi:8-oxo-dGTP diphosphatase